VLLTGCAITSEGVPNRLPDSPRSAPATTPPIVPSVVPPSASVTGSTRTSEQLAAIADQLRAWGCSAGLSGIKIDETSGSLVAWWKGRMPTDVRAFVQKERPGLTVEVIEGAKWDRSEMQSAAERIIADSSLVTQLGITSVAVNADGSGVTTSVSADAVTADEVQAVERVSGLPGGIRIVTGQGPVVPQ